MKIVFIGLNVSSLGNDQVITYSGLLKGLGSMGHDVYLLEHHKPPYSNRDPGSPEVYTLELYKSPEELKLKFGPLVRDANLVIVGCYVSHGVEVIEWVLETARGVTAFYDINTSVTLNELDKGDRASNYRQQIRDFDLYLSFFGGEVLQLLSKKYQAKNARVLHCSVDPAMYYPMVLEKQYDLGFLGAYSVDWQPTVENFLIRPANLLRKKKFVVAGSGYPDDIPWPENVMRIKHIPPDLHREFYNQQKFSLHIAHQAMIKSGFSPNVQLFEAAACAVPIISDYWRGLTDLFEEGKEIFISRSAEETVSILKNTSDEEQKKVGEAARKRIMNFHTAARRALELITYYQEVKHLTKRKVS